MRDIGLVISGTPEADAYAEAFIAAAAAAGMSAAPLNPNTNVELVVAVGGDGTVLEAAHAAVIRGVPVVGVNLGTIGFLAEAEPEELDETVANLAEGRFGIEERNTIEVTLPDGTKGLGINDVVVEKIDSQRLVVLDVEVDGEHFLRHRADGLVVATSTGSTAYSFSAGGPLMDPRVDGILVTPVAPHSLFDRSLVIPANSVVAITVADDRPVRVSSDGRELGSMNEGDRAVIGPGPTPAEFVRMRREGFPSRVTRKFRLNIR
ncbi:MAG TPA: NAD(+)/NADH kinase [Acidimicrobiia bacterium]|nr:NAD(+)/NADH kinase [Acidimicrobiia bacterium]